MNVFTTRRTPASHTDHIVPSTLLLAEGATNKARGIHDYGHRHLIAENWVGSSRAAFGREGWLPDVPHGIVMGMNLRTDAPTGDGVSGKTILLTCLGSGTLFFVLNDLLGLINGGGIFSAVSAIRSAHARVLSLDVDVASLRTPFIILCALLTTTIGMLLRLKLAKKWTQAIFLLGIIGGGFFVDAVYGPKIIENYLTGSDYYRCDVRDHAVGGGKGRVWFDNYVLSNSECVAHTS